MLICERECARLYRMDYQLTALALHPILPEALLEVQVGPDVGQHNQPTDEEGDLYAEEEAPEPGHA